MCVGCHSSASAATSDPKTHYYYTDSDSSDKGNPSEDSSKITDSAGATKQELGLLGNDQKTAEAEMNKNPTAETKSKYVQLTVNLADKTMYSDALDRHTKYSTALKLYNAALKVDPKNAHAAEAADTIVKIYKSLGKPVPQ